LLEQYTNPRWLESARGIDVEPRFDLKIPSIIDPNEYGRRAFYMNNRKIRRAYFPIMYTQEMLDEIQRCREDVIYFAARYFYIRTLDYGRIIIDLYDYQKEFLRCMELPGVRNAIYLAGRQTAKSTIMTLRILHKILFNEDYQIAILANKGGTAREIFSRVRLAYEELPLWMQPGVIDWNKGSTTLENGSKAFAASTADDSVRGFTLNEVLLDEFAFVKNDVDFYKSTLPVISSGTDSRLTMTSTPDGKKGIFYKTWEKAIGGNSNFFSFGVPWNLVPGRDEEWKIATIEDSSLLEFRIEHNIEFLSGKTNLIDTEVLEDIELHTLQNPEDEFEGVRIYENPEEGQSYVTIVDTAEGKGQDYSTFSVINVTEQPYRQVAAYQNNDISPLLFAAFVDTWAKHYNESQLVVENNNASGSLVAVSLRNDYDYDNLYCMNAKDEMGIGIRTTTKVKSIGCSTLRGLLRSKKLTVRDRETYNELCTFESKGTSYEASKGCTDDLVQNLWLFAWYTTQVEFEEHLEGESIADDIFGAEIEAIQGIALPGGSNEGPTQSNHQSGYGSVNDIW